MNEVVLKIENVSKQYRLGQLGTGSISHDINRWWYRMRGKPDPYLKVGDINERDKVGESEYVWSLKDINFDVRRGEVLGIIGKNGAGKSTLLKILSQVTSPTIGQVKVKGRIASLLEVGTGFHQDLTGRENIFLNGAILGMTRKEIHKKLDEIIEFSGIYRYIDTPVKRYSSGMMVRLGFSVAAHLEPEILIIDEVLAVGDAEFQNKCIGKMKDVSGQGRTVLFVSHNMSAIKSLCTKGILLTDGMLDCHDNIVQVMNKYSSSQVECSSDLSVIENRKGLGELKITKIEIDTIDSVIQSGEDIRFVLHYKVNKFEVNANYEFALGVWNIFGVPMFMLTNLYLGKKMTISPVSGKITFHIKKLSLNTGTYTMNLLIAKNGIDQDLIENAFSFQVDSGDYFGSRSFYPSDYEGFYQNFDMKSE